MLTSPYVLVSSVQRYGTHIKFANVTAQPFAVLQVVEISAVISVIARKLPSYGPLQDRYVIG